MVEGTLESIVEDMCNRTYECIFDGCNTGIFDKSNDGFILWYSMEKLVEVQATSDNYFWFKYFSQSIKRKIKIT